MTDPQAPQPNLSNTAPTDPLAVDPLAVPSPPPPTNPSSGSDDTNPLDALEQILKDAKAKGGGKSGSKEAEEAALKAQEEEEARKIAENQRLAEEQKVEDQQNLAEQIKNLQNVAETPEEQARLSQSQEKHDDDENKLKKLEENAIHQLQHTKI